MKKSFVIILLIFIMIIVFLLINYQNLINQEKKVAQFNLEYEEYNRDDVSGVDITSIINKATNNNEKYNIEKDENGLYIDDNKNSIKIFITMAIDGKTYPMEKINEIGVDYFTKLFGAITFKCVGITYHEQTSKVATITFEALQE